LNKHSKPLIICCLPLFILLSCSFNVNNATPAPWTILVYANGDNNLEEVICNDMKEMELSEIADTDIRVLILLDRIAGNSNAFGDFSDTRIYELKAGSHSDEYASLELSSAELGLIEGNSIEELNMGSVETLEAFLDFGTSYAPAERYALIIEDHGDGWFTSDASPRAISWDQTSSFDFIGTEELRQALNYYPIDIMHLDACTMGTMEVAWELSDKVTYLAACPGEVPAAGMNYTDLFNRLAAADYSLSAWAKQFCDSFDNEYPNQTAKLQALNLPVLKENASSAFSGFLEKLNSLEVSALKTVIADADSYSVYDKELYKNAYQIAEACQADEIIASFTSASVRDTPQITLFLPQHRTYYDTAYPQSLSFTTQTDWDEWLDYWFSLQDSGIDSHEPEDNFSNGATSITLNSSNSGYISAAGDVDFYSFTVSSATNINITLSVPQSDNYDLTFYKQDTDSSLIYFFTLANAGIGQTEGASNIDISTDTYVIKIEGANNNYYSCDETYTLSVTTN